MRSPPRCRIVSWPVHASFTAGLSRCGYATDMAENNTTDLRSDHVKQKLHDELADEQGRPAKPDDVDRVVDAKAQSLADASVQDLCHC